MSPSSPKILIVSADGADRTLLADILRSQGCALAAADGSDQAMAVYPEFKPDLVLLDAGLPGLGGPETGRRLRQAAGGDCAPLVFLVLPGDSISGEGLAAEYLRKPLQADEVELRVRTQLHIRQLEARQQELDAALAEAHAAKHRFLGNVAHDLRGPLGAIRELVGFLCADGSLGTITAEQRELLDMIQESSRTGLTLVNELLDAATIDAGGLKLVTELHCLAELVEASVGLARIDAARKMMPLALAVPAALPAVRMDAAKIKQVVDNLLSNALKYSPPGSALTVELLAEDRFCHLAVRDQGPGIPAEEQTRLFQDFGRLSTRPTGGENSTGLGLSICRKIVEAHGGTLVAENLPVGGCEFRFSLPLDP